MQSDVAFFTLSSRLLLTNNATSLSSTGYDKMIYTIVSDGQWYSGGKGFRTAKRTTYAWSFRIELFIVDDAHLTSEIELIEWPDLSCFCFPIHEPGILHGDIK
jgi:hypothetical protein